MRLFSVALFLVVFVSEISHAQIRFKPQLEGAASPSKDGFFLANYGLGIEKKIDIDKSIETGIYYHNFEFNFPKDQYGFYNAFIKNTSNDLFQDTITDYKVMFNFVSIPIGFNYYLGPRTYLNYKLGFNFFTSSTYQGIVAPHGDYTASEMLYKKSFPDDVFRRFYLSHSLSFNRIFLRRIDVGLSFIFTSSEFFKSLKNNIYRSFNNEVSHYFAVGLNLKFFVFQIDSKKI